MAASIVTNQAGVRSPRWLSRGWGWFQSMKLMDRLEVTIWNPCRLCVLLVGTGWGSSCVDQVL